MINVLSFLVSLVSLAAIRRTPRSDRAKQPGVQSIDGLKYALSRSELIGTTCEFSGTTDHLSR